MFAVSAWFRHDAGWLPVTAAVWLLVAGCGQAPPRLHPVGGVVVTRTGRPMTGATVEFRSVADPALAAIGEVQPDGTFTLATRVGNRRLPGAVAGPHHVTVIPPMSGAKARSVQPTQLAAPLTVQADTANHFTLPVEFETP